MLIQCLAWNIDIWCSKSVETFSFWWSIVTNYRVDNDTIDFSKLIVICVCQSELTLVIFNDFQTSTGSKSVNHEIILYWWYLVGCWWFSIIGSNYTNTSNTPSEKSGLAATAAGKSIFTSPTASAGSSRWQRIMLPPRKKYYCQHSPLLGISWAGFLILFLSTDTWENVSSKSILRKWDGAHL